MKRRSRVETAEADIGDLFRDRNFTDEVAE
jgi:hypothetical protein